MVASPGGTTIDGLHELEKGALRATLINAVRAAAEKSRRLGDHDPYGPVAEVEAVVATALEPKQMVWIHDADHFFVGKLDQVQAAIIGWCNTTFSATAFDNNFTSGWKHD